MEKKLKFTPEELNDWAAAITAPVVGENGERVPTVLTDRELLDTADMLRTFAKALKASVAERLDGLTLSECLTHFQEQATDRDKAIASIAELDHAEEGEIEFDGALVSEGDDNGAYVLAWVWADFHETALDKGDDEEGDDDV